MSTFRPPRFNRSHTRGLAACMVTWNIAAGVDVKWIKPRADLPAVARGNGIRLFSGRK